MRRVKLPPGLTHRPLAPGDESAVAAVMAAGQLADIGEVVIEEADIVSDWQRPSYDVGASTIGVFDGDRLVAYAELSGGDRGDAAVDPDYRGRGIGTYLASWMQEQARGRGLKAIGMPVPKGSPGDRLLEGLGYRVRWTSWVLALPEGRDIEDRALPPGYAIRTATESDHRATWSVIEDAFLEWSVRDRQSFEDFSAQVMQRPGFEPWNLRVVTDQSGEVVGAALILIADEHRVRGEGGRPKGPARPRSGPGAPRRCLLRGAGTWSQPVRALHRLPHRCPRPLRKGRDGGHLGVGEPGDRSLSSGALPPTVRPVL